MLTIQGKVIPGDQRGRELGFPTANLAVPPEKAAHAQEIEGVWAGIVETQDGVRTLAAISIGRRPTFYDQTGQLLLEAHLVDFAGDLYGTTLTIHLYEFIRGQVKFSSVDQLISCMNSDIATTRALLSIENSLAVRMTA